MGLNLNEAYDPNTVEDTLISGLGARVLGPNSTQDNLVFIPLNFRDGLPRKDVNAAPKNSVLLTGTLFSTKGQLRVSEKILDLVGHVRDTPASVIAIPVQLQASGHFTAFILARRPEENRFNIISFNPEGYIQNQNLIPENARERFREFYECKFAFPLSLRHNSDVLHNSTISLQNPADTQDMSCGPRVVAFLSHALTHPGVLCSHRFNIDDFVAPMAKWSESEMRIAQSASIDTQEPYLKKIHAKATRPAEVATLYQVLPML